MKSIKLLSLIFLTSLLFFSQTLFGQQLEREYYELTIYHIENSYQENMVDNYLQSALIPGMHRNGINKIGVFKPIDSEAEAGRKIFVLIPYKNFESYLATNESLQYDQMYLNLGKEYIQASHDHPPYKRIEKSLMRAFMGRPMLHETKVSGPKKDRIYELRSYEGATERLYQQKVKMFNQGEMDIFDRLGFNPIFYAETLIGATMPNLMYMTTFENMESRTLHWKSFGTDPAWEKMKVLEEYQNTVSKNVTLLLYPTEYSDL